MSPIQGELGGSDDHHYRIGLVSFSSCWGAVCVLYKWVGGCMGGLCVGVNCYVFVCFFPSLRSDSRASVFCSLTTWFLRTVGSQPAAFSFCVRPRRIMFVCLQFKCACFVETMDQAFLAI